MGLTRYNCFIGTSRGFLLSTTEKPKEVKNITPDFSSEVSALAFKNEQKEIIIGYQNGTIQCYDPSENVYLDTNSELEGTGGIVGLGCKENLILAGKSDGTINIWKEKKNKHFKINVDAEGTLNAMVLNESRNTIGTGGEKNDFKLWDIETQQCIFKAKSMGHDKLNLPIPTSIRGIVFFHGEPNLSCCCTKEGHVLVYDERKQRRPVMKFLESEASYTTIASAHRDRQCLVGSTRGYMQLLDMKVGKCLKTFTTFTGSITSIACDPIEPYIVSTSLDRHLRVHHLETKALLHKLYMKVNLTSLLVRPIVKEEKTNVEENNKLKINEEIDYEYENIFENMEVVVEDPKKQKESNKVDEINDAKNIFENIEVVVGDPKKKKKSKQTVEEIEDTKNIFENIDVVVEDPKKTKKSTKVVDEIEDTKLIKKSSKKKIKIDNESDQIDKVKRKKIVKNIFAK